ncbi:MAG: HipA family kinase [Candidatus Nitrosoabyssus spongiisocia]|nr:MAG: HipA family kinase [Nitrosopumilaceae archaeon AB1(1)]
MELVYAKSDHGKLECESVTTPHRIEATNGKIYAVKFPPCHEPNSNFNEYLGSCLAKNLKISVLEPYIMKLDADFIDNADEIRKRGILPGKYFATLFIEDAYNLVDYEESSDIINLSEVSKFIVFDVFIHNTDRHGRNIMIIPTSESNKASYKYVLIDHGRCFEICDGKLPYVAQKIQWQTKYVNIRDIRNSAEDISENVTPYRIDIIYENIRYSDVNMNHSTVLKNELTNRDSLKIINAIDERNGHLFADGI